MTYPIISLVMVMSIASGLVLFIVPKFREMFAMLKDTLPLPTRIVLGISDFVRGNIIVTILIGVGIYVGYGQIMKTKKGRYVFDMLRMKFPTFGELCKQIVIARFARTLGTLLRCGVPILKSLEIVQKSCGSPVLERAVGNCMGAVRGGGRLADTLQEEPIMPTMVIRMIDIGERTGQLEGLLEKVAKFYDERVNTAIESLTSLIEPMMIGVMGTVVGSIVFAIFLPIIKLTGTMGKS